MPLKNPMEDLRKTSILDEIIEMGEEASQTSQSLDRIRCLFDPASETYKLLTAAIDVCDIISGEVH